MGRFDTDFDKLHNELKAAEQAKGARNSDVEIFWHKLKFGDNIYRIIPDVDGTWMHAEYSHFIYDNIEKDRPVTCHYRRSNKKVRCPVCEVYFGMDEDARAANRNFRPANTFLVKAVNEEGRVGILSFTSTRAHRGLMVAVDKLKTQRNTNALEKGVYFNIIKTKKGERREDVEYTVEICEVQKTFDGQVAMITKMDAISEAQMKLADELPKLSELYPVYTVEEIEAMQRGEVIDRFKHKNKGANNEPKQDVKEVQAPVAQSPKVSEKVSEKVVTPMPVATEEVAETEDPEVAEYYKLLRRKT